MIRKAIEGGREMGSGQDFPQLVFLFGLGSSWCFVTEKNGIRGACSTVDILDCPNLPPDCPRHAQDDAPDDASYMPQMMAQTCPR